MPVFCGAARLDERLQPSLVVPEFLYDRRLLEEFLEPAIRLGRIQDCLHGDLALLQDRLDRQLPFLYQDALLRILVLQLVQLLLQGGGHDVDRVRFATMEDQIDGLLGLLALRGSQPLLGIVHELCLAKAQRLGQQLLCA